MRGAAKRRHGGWRRSRLGLGERAAKVRRIGNNGWIGIEMIKAAGEPLSQDQNSHPDEPVNKLGLDLHERGGKTRRPSMYNIVFYNDDYTPMDFVEFALITIFHMPKLDALALTLAVRTKGRGIAGTYTFEIAEQKQCDALLLATIEEYPLRIEVEKV